MKLNRLNKWIMLKKIGTRKLKFEIKKIKLTAKYKKSNAEDNVE